MGKERVVRPIVRSFARGFEREAAIHVRAGGHAVVWDSALKKQTTSKTRRCRFVFQKPTRPVVNDMGYWAILDMDMDRWSTLTAGPLRGLSFVRIPQDCLNIVDDRIVRDSIHPGSTRAMDLDCLECAACCRANKVILEDHDIERFERGGRPELARPPYVRKDGDRLVLRLLASRDCRHLQGDNKCGIYELRPDSCSTFPAGSECCLYSREEELGLVDGLKA